MRARVISTTPAAPMWGIVFNCSAAGILEGPQFPNWCEPCLGSSRHGSVHCYSCWLQTEKGPFCHLKMGFCSQGSAGMRQLWCWGLEISTPHPDLWEQALRITPAVWDWSEALYLKRLQRENGQITHLHEQMICMAWLFKMLSFLLCGLVGSNRNAGKC